MPVGPCALCLEIRELRDSHFLPAGFYRIMREGSGDDPVLVNKSAAFMSSAQARAHLLCGECEHRFNDGGEDWVLKNCWRSATNFPLHSTLMGATPFVDEEGFRSYEDKKIPGVEIDKLAYFGASIFWRAAVRRWTVGKEKDARLPLGPYQEALRLHLLRSGRRQASAARSIRSRRPASAVHELDRGAKAMLRTVVERASERRTTRR
jgi:hypothetical protein